MDFRTELTKWGYNKGNSVDVEILINEILPELFSKQERMYSEEDLKSAFFNGGNMKDIEEFDHWFKQFKKKSFNFVKNNNLK